MASLRDWLQAAGLAQYSDRFEANGIDLDVITRLDDADLRELGLNLGDRKRFLSAVSNMAETSSPSAGSANAAPVEAERRQLTVLFCDMVGFTELASRLDPEALQSIVTTYEDTCAIAIARYEGYVYQRLGDGIVAFFGYPLAHEGEAERAIRAGLDIIEAFSELEVPEAGRLKVRIGIATGMVVVGSAEKGAVGETMNLASRLQAVAPINTVVVSERVRRLAGGTFEYQGLGEQNLKGISQPTHAYRVAGVSQTRSRFEAAHGARLTPLVGRELELGLLMDRWARAQEGEGQVVLLCGEPGIGKSRILNALRERLEGEGSKSLRFQCSPYYVNSAFWPSINNFERALKFTRGESIESRLDKLESLIVGHYERPSGDVRFIAAMLAIPCEERYGELNITPQKFKDETLRTLVDLTEAAARMRASVMLYEDVHWADPTSLEVLDLLIDRVREIPLLVVVTYRPEFHNRWAEQGHVSALNLSKLTRTQSRAMISRLTDDKTLPDDLLDQVLAKTDGVPLFVEELTKSILESGDLQVRDDHYEYAGDAQSIAIPATLRDSLMARLDRYAPVKEIAQIGAAIGREFSYELIAAVAPLPKDQLDKVLAQLTESGLAFRRGTPPQGSYIFKHALVQDAAYDSLLKSKRQDLHDKIALQIADYFPETRDTEPEVLAHHLTMAGRLEDAIPLWRKAGELALSRMALTEAIAHLNKGLELLTSLKSSAERDAEELELRTSLGTAWLALKGWGAAEVWNSFYPALSLAKSLGRNDSLVPIYWGLVQYVMTGGRAAESVVWAQEMLDEARASGDIDFVVQGHMAVCTCYYWTGKFKEAIAHADRVLALYEDEKQRHLVKMINTDTKSAASAYLSQAMWKTGYPEKGARLSNQAVEHARALGHPFNLGHTLTIGSDVFDFRGEPAVLRKRADEAERVGRENNLPFLSGYLALSRAGIALLHEGKTADGIAQLKAGLAVWDESGGKVRSPYLKSVLAEAMAISGEIDDALKLLDEQIEQVEQPGWEERVDFAEILRIKGRVLYLKDDLFGAEQYYIKSLDVAREQQSKSWELRTSTSLAKLWQSQGKLRAAHKLLKSVYEWFTEGFDTKDLKEAKALLEALQRDEHSRVA